MAAAATDDRAIALVRTTDQWLRCAHDRTALDGDAGVVELAAAAGDTDEPRGSAPAGQAAGLAFDVRCRLYHSRPEVGVVQSWRRDPNDPDGLAPAPEDFVAAVAAQPAGDFTIGGGTSGPLAGPRGLATTEDDLIYVAESGRNRVLVYDLIDRRLVSVVRLADEAAAGPRPIDLRGRGRRVWALTEAPARLLEVGAHGIVGERPLPPGASAPTRIAVSAGGRLAILDPAAGKILVVALDGPGAWTLAAPAQATDLEFESDGIVVVARWPGQDFLRLAVTGPQPTRARLRARGYDGRGIIRAPDGRIGFWTGATFRYAIADRRRYVTAGTVTTFRLDGGDFQTTWGRLFLDACVPDGAGVRVTCAVADEPPDEDTLPRTPPTNAAGATVPFPELSPPMPPLSMLPAGESDFLPFYRREEGNELVWAVGEPGETFVTLEAPLQAPPADGRPQPALRGRYLWITLRLTGDGRVTPRVRCLRAEHPTHDTLRRLPKLYSADPGMESFLDRYLAPLAAFLGETDARSFGRAALLDPAATPDAALPWLASFIGLVLDERWAAAPRPGGRTVDARRQLVREAACLFRFRGTLPGLRRFIEIYAGVPVIILERFRVRGLGGAVLGGEGGPARAPAAVVGGGLRVGGTLAVGEGPTASAADAFRTHAHRFAVLLPGVLSDEQLAVIHDLVEIHRPAHTLFEICPIGLGLRLGLGAHLAISSFVGRSDRFRPARLGEALLGRGDLIGRSGSGTPLGTARLGAGVRVSS